jgi:hypothetical protein
VALGCRLGIGDIYRIKDVPGDVLGSEVTLGLKKRGNRNIPVAAVARRVREAQWRPKLKASNKSSLAGLFSGT